MKRIVVAMLAGLAAALTGCAATHGVNGRMEQSNEMFTGSISGSGYREGSGELTLVSGRATCKGSFVYTSRRRGEGVLNCNDGRSGPFRVAAVNGVGSGSGDLSGQRFTFRFDAS